METLFSNYTSTAEINEHLGFLDVDIPYKKLKAKIKTATNDIIDIIGIETYQIAVNAYKQQHFEFVLPQDSPNNLITTEIASDLVYAVQNPIAIQAYRLFAPHNDLAHTSSGRLNRLEDNQKSPFQWMIDKDDDALERSYYQSLDILIKFLDANITSWKESEQYKQTHKLFLNNAFDFDSFFPIGNSRLLLLKLAPGIRLCENKEIKPRIGAELFASLKEDPSSNESLLDKIKEACAYYSLAWAMRRLSVQLFPEGALQGYKSDRLNMKASKPAENNEPYAVAAYFEIDAKNAFDEIESMIYELNKLPTDKVLPMTYTVEASDSFLNT